MEKKIELETTLREIDILKSQLSNIKVQIGHIEHEMDGLTTYKYQLEENKRILKKRNIVALAVEFKKVKDDIAQIKRKINVLRTERDVQRLYYNRIEDQLNYFLFKYKHLSSLPEHQVLQGDFKKEKNGQK
jgi:hypothetical protein